MTVISLYDYTGEALKPWAEAGFARAVMESNRGEYNDTT